MKCEFYFGISSMKEGTSAQLSGRGELHGGLQVSQPPAGTHCETGPDATPICQEMLSCLLPLTPAGFTPEAGLSE